MPLSVELSPSAQDHSVIVLSGSVEAEASKVQVSPTQLRTVWDVTGPNKHQRIVTRFDRLDGAARN